MILYKNSSDANSSNTQPKYYISPENPNPTKFLSTSDVIALVVGIVTVVVTVLTLFRGWKCWRSGRKAVSNFCVLHIA